MITTLKRIFLAVLLIFAINRGVECVASSFGCDVALTSSVLPDRAEGVCNLSLQGISSLPPRIGQFHDLETLGLSHNIELTELPREMANLTRLKYLYLDNNKFSDFPKVIIRLEQLRMLHLANNRIREIPTDIYKLNNLRGLYLTNNQLTAFPRSIQKLASLNEIDVSGNRLAPAAIATLKQWLPNAHVIYSTNPCIKKVLVGDRVYSSVGEALKDTARVCVIDLTHQELVEMPETLVTFVNLRELRLHNNRLTHLSPKIASLTNLEDLYLFDNQLLDLPSEIGKLRNLRNLNLRNNSLTSLPQEVRQLRNLIALDLRGNRFSPEEQSKIVQWLPGRILQFQ
ncbi:MAG TPA: leucine-rich repeat domain-containing protein [Verrucomicrobiae bacterium]|nr:leucine-rich repeat domain-containing protein [Verrucomicrobiae bacterium]